MIYTIGQRLLAVFGKASGITGDKAVQTANMLAIVAAQKAVLFETLKPRLFVYQYYRLISGQRESQRAISPEQTSDFGNNTKLPWDCDGA